MKYRISSLLLVLVLLQGCVYYYPVNRRANVQPAVGKTVTTMRPLYLAKSGKEYRLLPDGDPIYHAPSFDDFNQGKWTYSYWRDLYNFKEIVPANTTFEITTVWEEFHMEVGCSYMVYGTFSDDYPGIKPRKVLLWKTMSDDILDAKEANYFDAH